MNIPGGGAAVVNVEVSSIGGATLTSPNFILTGPMPVGPPAIAENTGIFWAGLSVKFRGYEVCAMGACTKIRGGAFAAERLPMAGNAVSWRVRPWESRAVVPVLVCTMRLPSGRVWMDSFVMVAEFGAACMGA